MKVGKQAAAITWRCLTDVLELEMAQLSGASPALHSATVCVPFMRETSISGALLALSPVPPAWMVEDDTYSGTQRQEYVI